MLLAFSNTALVHADQLDNKIEAYKNIVTQISDNILGNAPNHNLHLALNQQLGTLRNVMNNLTGLPNAAQRILNLKMWVIEMALIMNNTLGNRLLIQENADLDAMEAMVTHIGTLFAWVNNLR